MHFFIDNDLNSFGDTTHKERTPDNDDINQQYFDNAIVVNLANNDFFTKEVSS